MSGVGEGAEYTMTLCKFVIARALKGSHQLNSPRQKNLDALRQGINLFAPGKAVREGATSWVVKLTWVRGLGTSIIQLSNFNYILVNLDVFKDWNHVQ